MIYDEHIQMDENLKLSKCPRCQNEQFYDDSEFCDICGLPVFNYCLGFEIYDDRANYLGRDDKKHKNYGNARYCRICGAETVFFSNNVLQPYDKYTLGNDFTNSLSDENDDDLPF